MLLFLQKIILDISYEPPARNVIQNAVEMHCESESFNFFKEYLVIMFG